LYEKKNELLLSLQEEKANEYIGKTIVFGIYPQSRVSEEQLICNLEDVINGNNNDLEVYKIGGNNYFQLRHIGKTIDFDVSWRDGVIVIEKDKPYTDD
jgi:hypothetical protein